MTPEELERHIEGQTESQSLDFKDDIPWDEKKMAKDFLAMSNVQDGGIIIIGVKELDIGFEPVGVTAENLKTYNYDLMKDKMSSYAEPAVQFRVDTPKDSKKRQYVVIKVSPFLEYPVMSKKDIEKELKSNTIYYRNSNKRPQSAPVSNLTDLQNIIERSAINIMARRKKMGYQVATTESLAEREIVNIGEHSLLNKIKSHGYWRVCCEPLGIENIELTKSCLELVENAQVKADWYFPVIVRGYPNVEEGPGEDFYQTGSEVGSRKQFWRMYTTGLFITYDALVEDWYAEDSFRSSIASKFPPGMYLMMYTSVIYYISSVFAFIHRLAANGIYKDGVKISFLLEGLQDRKLYLDDDEASPLMRERKTLAKTFAFEINLSASDLLTDHQIYANKCIIKILDRFSFNPPSDSIMIKQSNYLNGR